MCRKKKTRLGPGKTNVAKCRPFKKNNAVIIKFFINYLIVNFLNKNFFDSLIEFKNISCGNVGK